MSKHKQLGSRLLPTKKPLWVSVSTPSATASKRKALPELQRHALADNILDRFRERTGEAMPAPRGGRGARGRGRGRGGRGSAACP